MKNHVAAALLGLCLTAGGASASDDVASMSARSSSDKEAFASHQHSPAFLGFMSKHGKKYCDGDHACEVSILREQIWNLNQEFVNAHNSNPDRTFNMEMGRFADLSEEEFVKTQLKYRPSTRRVETVKETIHAEMAAFAKTKARLGSEDDENYDDLPTHFSWTEPQPGFGSVVGEVHNQQDICASCWAFVSADSIAGRWAVATRTDVVPMSVKQLMVCDHQDNGCNTGNMYTAYDWIGENGGLATQEAYDAKVPGETQDDERATCDASVPLEITTPGMCDLKMTAGNRALMIAIKEAGPVAIGINANNLQFYESGIIDAKSCPPAGRGIQSINHAALVVGWGEEGGTKYWLVKNSYGEEFGEHGYFKLERLKPDEDNLFGTCGLLFESVYPVVAKVGDEVDGAAQCTEGSVFKKDYYRNEEDNPGAAAYASAGALAEADAAVAAAASAALGKKMPTARLGEVRWGTKQTPETPEAVNGQRMLAATAGVAATAAAALVVVARSAAGRRRGGARGSASLIANGPHERAYDVSSRGPAIGTARALRTQRTKRRQTSLYYLLLPLRITTRRFRRRTVPRALFSRAVVENRNAPDSFTPLDAFSLTTTGKI